MLRISSPQGAGQQPNIDSETTHSIGGKHTLASLILAINRALTLTPGLHYPVTVILTLVESI